MLMVDKLVPPPTDGGGGGGSDALGNVAALRTFRVLRALKTVAVVPGMQIYRQVLGFLATISRSIRLMTENATLEFSRRIVKSYPGCWEINY